MIKFARRGYTLALLSVCALVLAACASTSDFGQPASEQEIIETISGNSFKQENGRVWYFDPDGTSYMLLRTPDLSGYAINHPWRTTETPAGWGTIIWNVQESRSKSKNGKIESFSAKDISSTPASPHFLIPQSDGGFIVKEPGSIGAKFWRFNLLQKGFVFEKEFNTVRRELGG